MNWRRLRTLVRREVQATFRDVFTVSILIAVPLGALLIFGFVLATDVKGLPLGVIDADNTASSRRLVAEIGATGTFTTRAYASRESLDRALVAGDISAALIIPPDFDRDLQNLGRAHERPQVQVIYDGGEATLAGNAEGFLRTLIANSTADSLGGQGTPMPSGGIQVVTRALFNPRLDGKQFMVAGTFGFVLSFLTVLITAVSIVTEKITGTFEQLQVTPATGLEILLGKILPLLIRRVNGFTRRSGPACAGSSFGRVQADAAAYAGG